MRSQRNNKRIRTAKRNSFNNQQILIVEDSGSREFFRFEDGKTVEYDLTRCNHKQVRLSEDEQEAARQFFHQ